MSWKSNSLYNCLSLDQLAQNSGWDIIDSSLLSYSYHDVICSVFVHSGQNLSFPLLLGKERIRVEIYHPHILGATPIGQLVDESMQVCAKF